MILSAAAIFRASVTVAFGTIPEDLSFLHTAKIVILAGSLPWLQ